MFNQTIAAVITAAALVGTATAQIGLEGPYASERWADTGLADGTTEISETVELYYDVVDSNPSNGVSFRASSFTTQAEATGVIRVHYDARFRHATFSREFFLQAIVRGPGGADVTTLVNVSDSGSPSEPSSYQGIVELHVTEGYDYTFDFGGAHYTNNPNLNGNLVLHELAGSTAPLQRDASQWTAGPITEGTAGVRTALQFDYFVDLQSGGVPFRTSDLTAYALFDGSTTCNWTYRANHNTFAATAELSLIAGGSEGENEVSLVDQGVSGTFFFRGRDTIDIEDSTEFGIRVGGSNFSSGSTLDGVVILSRFGVTEADEPEVCLADLNGDGLRDLTDINMFVNSFTAPGCP